MMRIHIILIMVFVIVFYDYNQYLCATETQSHRSLEHNVYAIQNQIVGNSNFIKNITVYSWFYFNNFRSFEYFRYGAIILSENRNSGSHKTINQQNTVSHNQNTSIGNITTKQSSNHAGDIISGIDNC